MVKLPSWADFSHIPAWSLDYFPSSEGRETEQKLTVFTVSREQHTWVLDARALADPPPGHCCHPLHLAFLLWQKPFPLPGNIIRFSSSSSPLGLSLNANSSTRSY